MEIRKYSDIKIEDMPIEVYIANASFQSTNDEKNKQYFIKGSHEKETVIGLSNHYFVGESFMIETEHILNNASLYIYNGNNANKIFTTKEEAIVWSNKDLGYIR